MSKLSFIIPCFNNAENIDDLFYALLENEKQFSGVTFEYVMVDDASKDSTFEILTSWQKTLPDKLKLLQLRKNIGSHKAVFKGLNMVTGDCVIVMASDLQDPPELSFELFKKWKMGSNLVLAIKDNPLSFPSFFFHCIMKTFFVKSAPYGAFDCALFDKYLIPKLQNKSVKNCNLFYRLVDLQSEFSYITYIKQKRKKGKSGWSFQKKIHFFSENILCYSLSKFGIEK